jgi:DNA-binding LacI/PurR family transcriptional regulator
MGAAWLCWAAMRRTIKPPATAASRRTVRAADVAALAGVSQSAVSRAFTPGASVAGETRARIESAASDLGYRPNRLARSLTRGESRLIGVAMGHLENYFYPALLDGIGQHLAEAGYRVVLLGVRSGHDSEPALAEALDYRVDGLMLAGTTLSSRIAEQCANEAVPVVLINRTAMSDGVSTVTGENFSGARLIADFLVAGGHRRPAFVAGQPESSTNRDRARGFAAGLAAHGLVLAGNETGNYDFDEAAAATRRLLRLPAPPDALFCASDHMALAAIEVARHEFGRAVGQDISVVGFDDAGPARWPSFALTTYAQPAEAMAAAAVQALLAQIERPGSAPVHQVVPGRLMVRQSARVPAGWPKD